MHMCMCTSVYTRVCARAHRLWAVARVCESRNEIKFHLKKPRDSLSWPPARHFVDIPCTHSHTEPRTLMHSHTPTHTVWYFVSCGRRLWEPQQTDLCSEQIFRPSLPAPKAAGLREPPGSRAGSWEGPGLNLWAHCGPFGCQKPLPPASQLPNLHRPAAASGRTQVLCRKPGLHLQALS